MTVYFFQCDFNLSQYGATQEKTGANLPNELCKNWIHFTTVEIEVDTPPFLLGHPKEIIADIEKKGYWFS